MSPPLPIRLRQIDASALPSLPLPTQKIHTDADIEVWRRTSGYADYMLFLKGLNEAVVDIELGWTPPFEIEVHAYLRVIESGSNYGVGYNKNSRTA